jgi:hypothetical protein
MTETDGRCESSLVLLFPRLDVHFTVYTRSMASSVVAATFHVGGFTHALHHSLSPLE